MKNNFSDRKILMALPLVLFAILYLSVSFNKEYIRPVYGNDPVVGVITGSFSNFMAAFIIALIAIIPLLKKKISLRQSRVYFYSVSILVFGLLVAEEFFSYFGASKTYDIYDILASALGSVMAIVVFEIVIKSFISKPNIN